MLCKPSPWSEEPPVGFPVPLPLEPPADTLVLLIGMPLTTISGELSPLKEDWPRMRILVEPPGPPAGGDTFKPATLPSRLFPTLVLQLLGGCSVLTLVATEPKPRAARPIPRSV